MVLRVIYREALERELVEVNIAASIKTPKVQVKAQKFLTWEEVDQINFGAQTKRIRFLALHGLRYGEAAALTKEDIHDGFVHITKSKHGATKTTAGMRRVPLLSEFVPFAKNLTDAQVFMSPLRPS
jgi:integrase